MALNDKLLERRNNGVGEAVDVREGLYNGQASTWPFCTERYARGKMELHLHLRIKASAEHRSYLSNYCAVFQSAHREGKAFNAPMTKTADVNPALSKVGMNQVYQSMFVLVRHFVKKPKRMQVWRPVCSVVRLEALNKCLSTRREASDLNESTSHYGATAPIHLGVPLGIKEDGELSLTHSTPQSPDRDGNKVVKPRAQVIETVPNNDTPFGWQWLHDLYSDHVLCGVMLEIEDRVIGVRVQEVRNLHVQGVEMYCRSPEFENTGQGGTETGSHVLYSQYVQGQTAVTKDSKGLRDSRSDKGRRIQGSRKGRRAYQTFNDPTPPEEVALRTALARHRGGPHPQQV